MCRTLIQMFHVCGKGNLNYHRTLKAWDLFNSSLVITKNILAVQSISFHGCYLVLFFLPMPFLPWPLWKKFIHSNHVFPGLHWHRFAQHDQVDVGKYMAIYLSKILGGRSLTNPDNFSFRLPERWIIVTMDILLLSSFHLDPPTRSADSWFCENQLASFSGGEDIRGNY